MKIVEVIPISRGISMETLSYFSVQSAPPGSLVSIPLRNRMTSALVVGEIGANEIKQKIKSLPYQMKKITGAPLPGFLLPEFIASAQKTANWFGATTGSVLEKMIPAGILSKPKEAFVEIKKKERQKSEIPSQKYILQTDDEERFFHYRSLIREAFAKRQSVFCLVPTIADGERIQEEISKGIEQYSFFFHSLLQKKTLLRNWKKSIEEVHPVLIIGTGSFLSIPREDIGTIVIEKESSRAYKTSRRPFIDFRTSAEIYAEAMNARIILSDTMLLPDTYARFQNGELSEYNPIKSRLHFSSSAEIIDMKKNDKEIQKSETFELFSVKLRALIDDTVKKQKNLFLFSARKGFAPLTVCRDCGENVVCNFCKTPVVLYKRTGTPNPNIFACQHCGAKRSADKLCVKCGSWRLSPLGIGTELVVEEIKKIMPDMPVFLLDKDTAKTHKIAKGIAEQFYSTKGSVLIGTEMALLYLQKKIANTAIVSIDSFLSLPDWRINEKILAIIFSMRRLALETSLIQTRRPEHPILKHVLSGNLETFFKEELSERQKFSYPPFATFIKISATGEKVRVEAEMEQLKKILTAYEPLVFPAFLLSPNGKSTYHALIRLPETKWVDKKLLSILLSLPPSFAVQVDPEHIL